MLIDSNIIIYAAQQEHDDLRKFIAVNSPVVSAISYVEVLGFHRLSEQDRAFLVSFFACATVLPLTQAVLDEAVRLRQTRRISLGDSLVASTCLIHRLTLVTRNEDDFKWITRLHVLNPFNLPRTQGTEDDPVIFNPGDEAPLDR